MDTRVTCRSYFDIAKSFQVLDHMRNLWHVYSASYNKEAVKQDFH